MAVTPTQAPATAAGPEIKDPTLTQQLMLDAPFGDDLCVISARGTGKSWGIVMLVARDAAHWKERYSCLITRTTYQGLTELQGLLWRYLSVAFPGTTYSGGDMTFRVGGKDMPFGRVELAYTGAGPAEQVRALARLQGRSFICAIHDEVEPLRRRVHRLRSGHPAWPCRGPDQNDPAGQPRRPVSPGAASPVWNPGWVSGAWEGLPVLLRGSGQALHFRHLHGGQ